MLYAFRKISASQTMDQFHLASSTLQQFAYINKIDHQESQIFLTLAKNYVLSGRSVSELCEHNSAVAREYGKPHVSKTIISTFIFMYDNLFTIYTFN